MATTPETIRQLAADVGADIAVDVPDDRLLRLGAVALRQLEVHVLGQRTAALQLDDDQADGLSLAVGAQVAWLLDGDDGLGPDGIAGTATLRFVDRVRIAPLAVEMLAGRDLVRRSGVAAAATE